MREFSTDVIKEVIEYTKGSGAKRSNYQNKVFETIKKQSLKPRYSNLRAIVVGKGVFSGARIIIDCKYVVSTNSKYNILIKIYKKINTHVDRHVARNSQWGAVLKVWGRSPQPP